MAVSFLYIVYELPASIEHLPYYTDRRSYPTRCMHAGFEQRHRVILIGGYLVPGIPLVVLQYVLLLKVDTYIMFTIQRAQLHVFVATWFQHQATSELACTEDRRTHDAAL